MKSVFGDLVLLCGNGMYMHMGDLCKNILYKNLDLVVPGSWKAAEWPPANCCHSSGEGRWKSPVMSTHLTPFSFFLLLTVPGKTFNPK